ncbi:DUF2799 domain-containing protein [Ferrimonas pelagia]|uniref:DUF2799 domain-containing protein n=1 Tax=Ferrimonas pelagia TaxID=1177826 RepID=A0ABP9FJ82_9GAMM
MHHTLRLAVLGLSLSLLGGCATMSEQECRTANWQLIGLEDGVNGQPLTRLGDRHNACSKHGVIPDQSAYQLGFDEGVRRYCTPANGYEQGLKGNTYHQVCPADLHDAFAEQYRQGKRRYEVQRDLARFNDQIESQQSDIHRLEREIAQKEAELERPLLPELRRAQLRTEIKQHKASIQQRESEQRKTKRLKTLKQVELAALVIPRF